jgi:hypothetical protein
MWIGGIFTVVAGIGRRDHWVVAPELIGLTVAGFSASGICLVVMAWCRDAVYRAASKHLGMRILLRNFPPAGDEAFRKWCTRHGVDPRRGGLH